ncbi:MAG: S41 family peptidase [Anaerolineae bacterium]|nr:S41 family peptidase [Anaerolineae bacterium]
MNKTVKIVLGVFIALLLLAGTFSGGMIVGWLLPDRAVAAAPALGDAISADSGITSDSGQSATPGNLETLFKPFWETWQIVHDQYVDQPVDDVALMRGAISGMLEALGDQHTSYMDPDQYRQANMPMDGEYEGIGAWVDTTGDYVKIVSPMPNSPAEAAGLKANDVITKVDGEDMLGIDGNLVLRRILGPAGTDVTLTLLREGTQEPFDVTITRAKIVMSSVEGKMLEGDIAYVQIFTFGEKTTSELRKTLSDLMAQNPKGMVVDLRNNGGGYLQTAIEVVSQFVDKGVVMYEEYGDGQRKEFKAMPGGLATKIPLVVLINEGTASASEITAGAIQDFGRGQLVGVTSYGKGSVQNWIPLADDQGAVRVTIARWLTPNERQIHGVGLTPDVTVELTEEDITANQDPQLDKAVEILTNSATQP